MQSNEIIHIKNAVKNKKIFWYELLLPFSKLYKFFYLKFFKLDQNFDHDPCKNYESIFNAVNFPDLLSTQNTCDIEKSSNEMDESPDNRNLLNTSNTLQEQKLHEKSYNINTDDYPRRQHIAEHHDNSNNMNEVNVIRDHIISKEHLHDSTENEGLSQDNNDSDSMMENENINIDTTMIMHARNITEIRSSVVREESNSNTFCEKSNPTKQLVNKDELIKPHDPEILNHYDQISDDEISTYSTSSSMFKAKTRISDTTVHSVIADQPSVTNDNSMKPFREIFENKIDRLNLLDHNKFITIEQQLEGNIFVKDNFSRRSVTPNPIIKLNDKVLDPKSPSPLTSTSNSCSNSSPEAKQLATDVAFVQNVFNSQYFINDSQGPSQNNNPVSPINEQSNDLETSAILDELDQYEKGLDDITTENENELMLQSTSKSLVSEITNKTKNLEVTECTIKSTDLFTTTNIFNEYEKQPENEFSSRDNTVELHKNPPNVDGLIPECHSVNKFDYIHSD